MRLDNNKQLDEFIDVLVNFESKDELKKFLEAILTPKELLELPNRLSIIKLLKKGISQHEIAETLGVGVATVGRGSKELQKGNFKNV